MRECLKRNINPKGGKAPPTIAEAQKRFFGIYNGKLSSIDSKQRAALAGNIALVATGGNTKPSLSIIDMGEGQSPQRMPETILSLTKSNKLDIPFVQGKFGMGGSGVLRFCGSDHNLSLVISRRHRDIPANLDRTLYGEDTTRDLWGVTIIRREDPKGGERSSRYTYLAPHGKILSFRADELKLMPGAYPEAYGKPLVSDTFVRLYEYNVGAKLRSAIHTRLMWRLAFFMPDIAVPAKVFERRPPRGNTLKGKSSYQSILAGLRARLDDDKMENLEPGSEWPGTGSFTAEDQQFRYAIYVFKPDKKKGYTGDAKRDGIVFSVHGQLRRIKPTSPLKHGRKDMPMDW
ncbi:MAG: hypothetical protein GDA54_01995 [Alphaproteobacteria bacterium GM7ARS4]|nr:hypothetical protein [Alphaproteobacteria bacterium GM7ARS4]